MPLYACSGCDGYDNTALTNYYHRRGDGLPLLCSACDPDIGKWHGQFPRRSRADAGLTFVDSRGHLWTEEIAARERKTRQAVCCGDNYLIWSNTHGAWWRANRAGYTLALAQAGRYTREEAISQCATGRDGYTAPRTPAEIPLREDAVANRAGRALHDLIRPEDDAECRARDLARKRRAAG